MEPISLTASITAITQSLLQIYTCAKEIKHAKADIKRLCNELFALKGVLEHVQLLATPSEDERLSSKLPENRSLIDFADVFKSQEFNGVVQDTKAFLDRLQEKLESPKGHIHMVLDRLAWPFNKAEIGEHIARIERVKSYFIIVLLRGEADSSRSIQQEIHALHDVVVENIKNQAREQREKSKNAILESFAPVNPTRAHQKACETCLPDTGQWLLHGETFQGWCSSSQGSIILLCGKSGAGKTIMISSAIEHVMSTTYQCEGVAVAYFYCSFNDAASQEPVNILGSLIAQLVQKRSSLLPKLETALEKYQGKPANLPLQLREELLQSFVDTFEKVYIFIDAINECASSKAVYSSIATTFKSTDKAFLCLTNTNDRPELISELGTQSATIAMQPNEIAGDVEAVIEANLQHNSNLSILRDEIKKEIRAILVHKAQGMFRWVRCQLDLLATCRTPYAVRKALAELPSTIEDTYDAILNRINTYDKHFARNTLLWLSYARRPLKLTELCEAIVFEDDCIEVDDDRRFPNPYVVLEICRGLVSIDPNTRTVALAHFSVKMYLTSSRARTGSSGFYHLEKSEAEGFMAEQCLRYLSSPTFCGGFCSTSTVLYRLKHWPLLKYAAGHWAQHVECLDVQLDDSLAQLISDFFDHKTKPLGGPYGFWLRALNPADEWKVQDTEPLYYASSYGLTNIVRNMLQTAKDVNIDALGGRGKWTALQAACFREYFGTAQLLLQHGADPNKTYPGGATPIVLAIENQDPVIVELLLQHGADPNKTYPGGVAPIVLAIEYQDPDVVELLLQHGADPNKTYLGDATPIDLAIENRDSGIVELLLQHGADLNQTRMNGETPLDSAARAGNLGIVNLLLQHGADPH